LTLLIKDTWRAPKWKDKFTIWFKPTGWRPENFEELYPVNKIENDFNKYGTQNSQKIVYWSVAQVLITLLFVTYLFDNIAKIGLPNIFVYGFFILITIYSYSELMDKSKYAVFWEGFRFLSAIGIITFYGDWFGLNHVFSFANYIIAAYLTFSFIASLYFVTVDFKVSQNQLVNS
jgi:hypothetical protein